MCQVTIVELIKLQILLDYLFIDINQYKQYRIKDISKFSFFSQNLGSKMGLNDPRPLTQIISKTVRHSKILLTFD